MIQFLMKRPWIGQAAHLLSNNYNITDWGGLPYKPGGFLEVSSPYLLLIVTVIFYVCGK